MKTALLWCSAVLLKIDVFSEDFSDVFIEARPNGTADTADDLGLAAWRRSLAGFGLAASSWSDNRIVFIEDSSVQPLPSVKWMARSLVVASLGKRAKHGVKQSWSKESVDTWENCVSQSDGSLSFASSSLSKAPVKSVAAVWLRKACSGWCSIIPGSLLQDTEVMQRVSSWFNWLKPLEQSSAESSSLGELCFIRSLSCWHRDSNSTSWPKKLKFGEMLGLFSFTNLQDQSNAMCPYKMKHNTN